MAAADRYFENNGRRLTFEYVLLGDLNDQPQHARELVALLRGRTALLNVIPYNPVAGLPYQTPSARREDQFLRILTEGGINVQVRQRKGAQIDAACGQLRRSFPATVPLAGAGLKSNSLSRIGDARNLCERPGFHLLSRPKS